jgi:hypothetical protein
MSQRRASQVHRRVYISMRKHAYSKGIGPQHHQEWDGRLGGLVTNSRASPNEIATGRTIGLHLMM